MVDDKLVEMVAVALMQSSLEYQGYPPTNVLQHHPQAGMFVNMAYEVLRLLGHIKE